MAAVKSGLCVNLGTSVLSKENQALLRRGRRQEMVFAINTPGRISDSGFFPNHGDVNREEWKPRWAAKPRSPPHQLRASRIMMGPDWLRTKETRAETTRSKFEQKPFRRTMKL